jgi:hypothetical protein
MTSTPKQADPEAGSDAGGEEDIEAGRDAE